MIGQVVLGLSILIVLHELGHFLAARAFGIKVEKFYLFFDAWGVKLFKFKYKDCEYGIGWLPLGGYVKIAGMIDESMDVEQLKQEPQPWEFRSKPAWQRLIVMLGGVIVNVILGVFIFWMLTFAHGETFINNDKMVNGVVPGIIGKELGIQPGDRITHVNGEKLVRFNDVFSSDVLMGNAVLTIDRAGQNVDVHIPGDILNKIADHTRNELVTERHLITKVVELSPGSVAEQAGIQQGDSLIAINEKPVRFFDEMRAELVALSGKKAELSFIRDGQVAQIPLQVPDDGTLGFYLGRDLSIPHTTIKYGFFEALPIGAHKAWTTVADNAKGIGKIFKGDVRADKALSGPIGIAQMFGSEVNWLRFWTLVGLLSMVLALMNLLPIPALDGGHVVFLLVEIIQGKPLSDRFLERAQIVGFVILLALMIFVFGNDIFKLFK